MAIEFRCDECNKLLRTSDERAGLSAKCPDCGASLRVPGGATSGGFASDYDFGSGAGETQGAAAGYKTCPVCGEQIRDVAVKCRHCGEYLSGPSHSSSYRNSHLAPHRGGMILAFGILSWAVCPLFGIAAWVMGNGDMAEIDAGRMDPEGRSLTQAGKIVGMIHCITFIAIIAIWLVIVLGMGLAFAL